MFTCTYRNEYEVLIFREYTYFSGDFSCSLYKLRLKFEETTRVVCTDFAEVLRIGSVCPVFYPFSFNFSYAYSYVRPSLMIDFTYLLGRIFKIE